jgi:hypothetical protein
VQKPSVGIGSGAGSAVTARAGCAVTTIQRCDRRIQLRQRGVQQKLKLGASEIRSIPSPLAFPRDQLSSCRQG